MAIQEILENTKNQAKNLNNQFDEKKNEVQAKGKHAINEVSREAKHYASNASHEAKNLAGPS